MKSTDRYLKLIVLLVFFCWTGIFFEKLNAQSIEIEGQVFDPQGNGLELVNIVAYSIADGSVKTFAISDFEGKFKVELEKDSSYLIKAIYLGYDEWTKEINVNELLVHFMTIDLTSSGVQLEQVTVTHKMPVIVRGDTVSYRAESLYEWKRKKVKRCF